MSDYTPRTPDQLPSLLSALRRTAGLSQVECAIRLGVTQQSLSALERRAPQASMARVMALLQVLGVELVLRQTGAPAGEGGPPLVAREPTPDGWSAAAGGVRRSTDPDW